MEDRDKHIYKKVASGNIINIGTINQDIDQDQNLKKIRRLQVEILITLEN